MGIFNTTADYPEKKFRLFPASLSPPTFHWVKINIIGISSFTAIVIQSPGAKFNSLEGMFAIIQKTNFIFEFYITGLLNPKNDRL